MPAPLALTMGDPAGIGGEIALAAWRVRRGGAPFVMLDDPARLRAMAGALNWDVPVRSVATMEEGAATFATALPVLPLAAPVHGVPGRPDPANAPAILEAIERAVRLARLGEAAGVVTNPIHKASLAAAGFPYPGHTEFLAALTGTVLPVMMLVSPAHGLRVVPVTVHMSLRRAIEMLTTELIVAVARVTAAGLRARFGLDAPRLALAGLNPHAGEEGVMGGEEAAIIAPAIAALRAEGVAASGPYPADSLFTPAARARYDVALGMYHDQALIPIKTLDMAGGVNVTLGLPILRTSPDHGTAFDIAGKGVADPASLLAAIDLAAELAGRGVAAAV